MPNIEIEKDAKQMELVQKLRQAALDMDNMDEFIEHALYQILPPMDIQYMNDEFDSQGGRTLETYWINIRR